jgi:hypothetical protein
MENHSISNVDPFREARTAYLDRLDAAGGDFVTCEDLAGALDIPYFSSLRWSGVIFRAGASPHDAAVLRSSIHVATTDTFDLIRYEYDLHGMSIVVLESAVFVYTEVGNRQTARVNDLGCVVDLLKEIYEIVGDVQFSYIDERAGLFSSAPNRDLSDMESWVDRIDGLITASGAIGFLIYKVHLEHDDIYQNPSKWFPRALRRR